MPKSPGSCTAIQRHSAGPHRVISPVVMRRRSSRSTVTAADLKMPPPPRRRLTPGPIPVLCSAGIACRHQKSTRAAQGLLATPRCCCYLAERQLVKPEVAASFWGKLIHPCAAGAAPPSKQASGAQFLIAVLLPRQELVVALPGLKGLPRPPATLLCSFQRQRANIWNLAGTWEGFKHRNSKSSCAVTNERLSYHLDSDDRATGALSPPQNRQSISTMHETKQSQHLIHIPYTVGLAWEAVRPSLLDGSP